METMCHIIFCDWLLLLGLKFSKWIPITCISTSILLVAELWVIVWLCHILFIYQLMGTWVASTLGLPWIILLWIFTSKSVVVIDLFTRCNWYSQNRAYHFVSLEICNPAEHHNQVTNISSFSQNIFGFRFLWYTHFTWDHPLSKCMASYWQQQALCGTAAV